VQRLANEVMRARLPRPVRQRAAGEVDALLELTFVAGDQSDVIEGVGVARVVAEHLRIAVHGERNLAGPVMDEALLDQFAGGLRFTHAGL
jgi:hypothetical protein